MAFEQSEKGSPAKVSIRWKWSCCCPLSLMAAAPSCHKKPMSVLFVRRHVLKMPQYIKE